MTRRRGLGLGTALIVVALLSAIGLLMASLSVTHLGLMSRESNQAIAGDLARSALALAVGRIFHDKQLGTPGHPLTVQLTSWPGAPSDARGLLTFEPTQATSMSIPFSTNNLLGDGSVMGAEGIVVPLQGVHLVAVGRCNGITRRIDAILHVPPFPFAVAADGPLTSSGQLQVGASEFSPPPGTTVDHMNPAVVASNAGITLGPNTTVKGDLKATGSISLDPGTNVIGQVQPGYTHTEIPDLNLASYDPEASGKTFSAIGDEDQAAGSLGGRWKRTGNLHYAGDLELVGAVLYVSGNLTVDGSLKGTGLVITAGNMSIGGQAQMTSADQVALMAGGDLTILGSGPASSSIRGVVYSEGNFSARRLKLEGALITRQRTGPQPSLGLDEVLVVGIRGLSRFSFPLGVRGAGSIALPVNNCGTCSDLVPPDGGGGFIEGMTSIQRLPNGKFTVAGTYLPGREPFKLDQEFDDLATVVDPNATRMDLQNQFVEDHLFLSPTGTNINQAQYQLAVDGLGDPAEQAAGANEIITFDPSKLVALARASRIVSWKER